jgi:DNA-binding transcriptional regulator YiaG
MARKKGERICWEGFGFPVILNRVTFKMTPQGYKIMDVNMKRLRQEVLLALVLKKSLLSGAELKFIRSSLEMSQKEFANFIDVAGHSSIAQWERKNTKATGMSFHTELVMRLRVGRKLTKAVEIRVMNDIATMKSSDLEAADKPLELDPDEDFAA